MKLTRYLYPNSHRRKYKRSYRISKSSMFSAFWTIKFILNIAIFLLSTIIGIAIFTGGLLYKLIKRIRDYRHYKDIGMNSLMLQQDILRMDGFQFEIFCAELYKALGYKAIRTQNGNDHGRDVILDDDTFVECKHYTGNNLQVGREICQKLIGSMEYFDIKKGIIFTTGKIHNNAYEYAKGLKYKSLEFVDLNDIMTMLFEINVNKVPNIMSKAMAFTDDNLLNKMDNYGNKIENFNNNLDRQY